MRQRDGGNTGRADFSVPAARLGTNFFDIIRWQKPSPDSPNNGNFGASAMVFFDSAGPGGADVVTGGYHWPKGLQGMDRHTGKLFWAGNPDGGESVGENTPAFSTNGTTLYVMNDATPHPLMAFAAATGPATFWHNGGDPDPSKLSAFSPKVASDHRIFAHSWNDRPYGATDSGSALNLSWSAASGVCECYSCPAVWQDTNQLIVVSPGRCGTVKAWDGSNGAELWTVTTGHMTDADPTVDPANGRIYFPAGNDSIWIVGLDKTGAALWGPPAIQLYSWTNGVNNAQLANSAGCLACDGQTYFFQTVSQQGDGRLYAVHTSDGSLKWSLNTGSQGWEINMSSPIITSNGVIIVGNNQGGAYLAILDAGTNGVILDTLAQDSGAQARSSATLAPDGLLYLPVRVPWTEGNGDGDNPSLQAANVFTAFDLNATSSIVSITNNSLLPPASVGSAYSVTLMATGGVPPYRWIVLSGKLPSGTVLNTNTGVLSGTPAIGGTYTFRVQVSSAENQTAQKNFTLAVALGSPVKETVSTFLSTPASNSLYTIPVVIIRFLPTTDGVNLDVTKAPDFRWLNPITLSAIKGNIDAFTDRVKFGFEQGTRFRGYKNPTAPPSLGYKVVDILTYYEHTPAGPFYSISDIGNQIHCLDYSQIMQAINGSNYVNNLGVREFWVWHGYFDDSFDCYKADPTFFNLDDVRGLQESNMSSPLTGDISNSIRFDDLPVYGRTYTVFEFNIRNNHASALHNRGHQLERLLEYAYNNRDGNADFFWKKFVGNNANFGIPVTGRCGWTHSPPNALNAYYDAWFNPAVVMSDIQDWRPDGLGTKTPFGTNTFMSISYPWPGGYTPGFDDALWHLFWWQSMPGFNNAIPDGTNGIPNWWIYTADWDAAISGTAVPPVMTAGPTNRTAMAGQASTFAVAASSFWMPANYRWLFNGQTIVGATNSSLTLTNVTSAQGGSYSVEVYNLAGATTSVATLTVTYAGTAQGLVDFRTQNLGTNAWVYDDVSHWIYLLGATNYGPGAQGTNWFAQLYAAPGVGASAESLVPVGQPVNFRSIANAGYVQVSGTTTLGWPVNPTVTVPTFTNGGPATVQLRAWWGGGTNITSYEAAIASSGPNSRWGESPLLDLAITGDPAGPRPPVGLTGLVGFHLHSSANPRTPVSRMTGGAFQLGFYNTPGALFDVLASTNLALPSTNWTVIGSATEVSPGQFQFTDPLATNSPRRFYRVRTP